MAPTTSPIDEDKDKSVDEERTCNDKPNDNTVTANERPPYEAVFSSETDEEPTVSVVDCSFHLQAMIII